MYLKIMTFFWIRIYDVVFDMNLLHIVKDIVNLCTNWSLSKKHVYVENKIVNLSSVHFIYSTQAIE